MTERQPSAAAGADDWDRHWHEYATANERNPAQEYRRRLVLKLLERDGVPSRVLDVGSGQGEFLAAAAARWPGAQLLGLEVSSTGVQQSRAKVPSARFRVCDLLVDRDPPPAEARWATHAACSEVLEHVDDPVALVRNARAWLAPGCRIVFTVPGGPMSAFDKHIGHRRHFSPAELGDMLRAAGLEVVQLSGAGFPFFNVYRSLVIARGERLVDDATGGPSSFASSVAARAAMSTFTPLFRLNLPHSRAGWQTVGVAREPGAHAT